MDLRRAIFNYSTQPITHQLLLSLLKDYKRPNDKIHALLHNGVLKAVKKGLYIAGPAVSDKEPESFLLANHISGPSYVSLDTALSYHGWIPERVFEVASVTTKDSRKFDTPTGLFTYTHLPLPYYAFGIEQAKLADDRFAMVASAEKALFDKVITTSGLTLRSSKQVRAYLAEDLRIDEDRLTGCNLEAMTGWLEAAPKRSSLTLIVQTLQRL